MTLFFRVFRRAQATNATRSTTTAKTTKTPSPSDPPQPLSSCASNTVLAGLNYLKGQPPVLARPDEEYPSWLWTILAPKMYEDDGPGGKAERVQRRAENRRRIKDQNFMKTQ